MVQAMHIAIRMKIWIIRNLKITSRSNEPIQYSTFLILQGPKLQLTFLLQRVRILSSRSEGRNPFHKPNTRSVLM